MEKTSGIAQNLLRIAKHLHGRGEDPWTTRFPETSPETPPRTWRRLCTVQAAEVDQGNTSTDVEKTSGIAQNLLRIAKHLHGRGEDIAKTIHEARRSETPPRTWRRLIIEFHHLSICRNTSTDVEKTKYVPEIVERAGKHLHGRGEDSHCVSSQRAQSETPPRTWRRLGTELFPVVNRRNTSTDVEKTDTSFTLNATGVKHLHGRGED